jgi:hypothetical protein
MARIPVRIEEAIGIKWSDFEGHVWTLKRVVYEGQVCDLDAKEQRRIPIMDEVLFPAT